MLYSALERLFPPSNHIKGKGDAMINKILDNMKWLGHDGFLVKAGGKTLVFDPYTVTAGEPADLILISHEHFDHCSPDDVARFQKEDSVIVTEPQAGAKLTGDVRTLAPGETLDLDGIKILAVASYNTDKPFHPRDNQWLGFVVTLDGVSIYHAGDTDLIPEMEGLDVDIALLPVSGTYVMTWEQAVEAAKQIRPKAAVPMHYGGIVGTDEDAKKFADALEGVCEVRIFT